MDVAGGGNQNLLRKGNTIRLDTRIILSGLWITVMLLFLMGDVLRIYRGDFARMEAGKSSSSVTWLGAAISSASWVSHRELWQNLAKEGRNKAKTGKTVSRAAIILVLTDKHSESVMPFMTREHQQASTPTPDAKGSVAEETVQDSSVRQDLVSQKRVQGGGDEGTIARRQQSVLAMQRTQGNAAVRRMLKGRSGTVQRIGNEVSSDGAVSFRQARSLIDRSPMSELPRLRADIEYAMQQHPVSISFTLQLGSTSIPDFLSDQLSRLIGFTDVGSRQNFERDQQDANARISIEAAQRDAADRRIRTMNYLRSLDNPESAVVRGQAMYSVINPSGQRIFGDRSTDQSIKGKRTTHYTAAYDPR